MIKTMSETKNNQAIDPDLTAPLADTELIPEHLFHEKLKAIFSVPKSELDQQLRDHPEPPQKRGRKPSATK